MSNAESEDATKLSNKQDRDCHPAKDTLRSTSPYDSLLRKKISRNLYIYIYIYIIYIIYMFVYKYISGIWKYNVICTYKLVI